MNDIDIEGKRKERELAMENRKMQKWGRGALENGRKRPREGIIMRWGIKFKIKGEKQKKKKRIYLRKKRDGEKRTRVPLYCLLTCIRLFISNGAGMSHRLVLPIQHSDASQVSLTVNLYQPLRYRFAFRSRRLRFAALAAKLLSYPTPFTPQKHRSLVEASFFSFRDQKERKPTSSNVLEEQPEGP